MLKKGERVNAITIYLAHRKCATLDEILNALKQLHERSKAKNVKIQTLVTLSRMKRAGLIRRTWIYVDARRKKKKRLYCIKSSLD